MGEVLVAERVDRIAIRPDEREAAEDELGADRADQRVDSEADDQPRVEEPCGHADREPERDGEPGPVAGVQRLRARDAAEGDDRSDREVELAADQDEGRRRRDDTQVCGSPADVDEVPGREEELRLRRHHDAE